VGRVEALPDLAAGPIRQRVPLQGVFAYHAGPGATFRDAPAASISSDTGTSPPGDEGQQQAQPSLVAEHLERLRGARHGHPPGGLAATAPVAVLKHFAPEGDAGGWPPGERGIQ
jgi:hypothetical protein